MTRIALLCPGQAGQHAGMFDLARQDDATARWLDTLPLADLCGAPLDQVLADPARLYANRCAQPLVVAATLAAFQALRPALPAPTLVLGYSVGEVTAHAVAGAWSFSDAITLAAERARLMDAAAAHGGAQGLMGVTGIAVTTLTQIASAAGLYVAIVNGEDSVVLGGHATALSQCAELLSARGARVTPLPVTVASHTPLLAQAVPLFAACVTALPHGTWKAPVLAGIDAHPVTSSIDAAATLSAQLGQTIRWADCMDACAEAGVTLALELGPGNALARMLAQRHPAISCRSVADFRSLDGVRRWVESQR